jgi:DNA replication and repair protein RecF
VGDVWVSRMELTDFRNYAEASVALDPGLNLFLGLNAQGKTNLLESVYVASAGRSYRASSDADLVRWECPHFRIVAYIDRKPSPVRLEISYSRDGRRLVRLNGTERIRGAELASFLNVVMFTPDDLALVKGSPGDRRRFLDLEIAQVSPAYRNWVSVYSRTVAQRNALLKQVAAAPPAKAAELLAPWDDQLTSVGARVIARRAEVIAELDRLGREAHCRITGTPGNLAVRYLPSVQFEASDVQAIARAFKDRLAQIRRVELIRGFTMCGPHRDDILFELDDVNVAAFGSQGQQRSTVLAVKLAEVEFIRARTGDQPVLLLDDVLSELDERRRAHLLAEVVGKYQTLVTSVEPGCVEMMPSQAKVFTIDAGQIRAREVAADAVPSEGRAEYDSRQAGLQRPPTLAGSDASVE